MAATSTMAFLKFVILPDLNLIAWVLVAMAADFGTGVLKAIVKKEARTSSGYRKTVVKFTQYGGAIAVGVIMSNTLPPDNMITGYVNNALLIFIIYIEVTSICENIYAIDSSSMFSRYFISPLLKVLTFAIKKMSVNQTAGEGK